MPESIVMSEELPKVAALQRGNSNVTTVAATTNPADPPEVMGALIAPSSQGWLILGVAWYIWAVPFIIAAVLLGLLLRQRPAEVL